jgi:hypothetical protein
MSRKNQREEEAKIIKSLLSFPAFLNGTTFTPAAKDPPDFVGQADSGQSIGLELTSWLSCEQTTAADGRNKMRRDLLRIIECGGNARPENISSAVVMPQWGTRIPEAHEEGLGDQFRAIARDFDKRWKELRSQHWRSLRPEERFDYLVHKRELTSYPTVRQYISSIWFFERTELSPASDARPWVSIESDGGIYDPAWSRQALKDVIENKVIHYSDLRRKAYLDSQNLHKLYLLVYAESELFDSNTSWQTATQLMVSPVEGLAEAGTALDIPTRPWLAAILPGTTRGSPFGSTASNRCPVGVLFRQRNPSRQL